MTEPKTPPGSVSAIMNALADHAESMTDKELLEEAAAHGVDPKEEGAAVRGLLLDATLRVKKDRLRNADEGAKGAVAALAARTSRLPSTSAERRELLRLVVQQKPQMRDGLTLQYRNFESLSDADVESALKQLDALGLLDDVDPSREPDPKP